ncbi:MAG: hypothetical protein ACXVQU_04460 [Actinomycetota bacterium]
MRWSDEWWLYVGAIVMFAGVVLWGTTITESVPLAIAASGLTLVLIGLVRARATDRVLVVGPRRTEGVDAVDATLDTAGYEIVVCDGPSVRPCPAEAHGECRIHARVSGIVIVREAGDTTRLPPCGDVLHVPAIAVDASDEGLRGLLVSLRA